MKLSYKLIGCLFFLVNIPYQNAYAGAQHLRDIGNHGIYRLDNNRGCSADDLAEGVLVRVEMRMDTHDLAFSFPSVAGFPKGTSVKLTVDGKSKSIKLSGADKTRAWITDDESGSLSNFIRSGKSDLLVTFPNGYGFGFELINTNMEEIINTLLACVLEVE